MLRNYFRTTLRVLSRHRLYTLINLAGLSIGIATAILLLLFVRNELTFDRQHANADRIYRAWVLEDYGEDQRFFNTTTPVPLAQALKDEIPEVEAVVRYDRLSATVKHGSVGFNESLYMVDDDFLSVFDFPLISGNRQQLFSGPDQIALTRSAAIRYFGSDDPVGSEMAIEFEGQDRPFEVVAVLKDPPENSSLQFQMLLPYAMTDWYYPERMMTAWFNVGPETYVLLREGASLSEAESKLPALVDRAVGDRVERGQYRVGLQPLTDIHMDPAYPEGYSAVVNPVYVRILFGIAGLILAIACINFVTLSVSRSTARSREIGVRKVVGADRMQLLRQFWGEAMSVTALALGIGLVLSVFLLPSFNALSSRHLQLSADAPTLGMLATLFLVISLLAGAYPAFVLSGFKPYEALRGRPRTKVSHGNVRKALVVVQFSLAIVLSASAVVMSRQLSYIGHRDLGFDPSSVVVIPTEYDLPQADEVAERLRFATAGRDDIASISASTMLFDSFGWGRIGYNATDGTYKRFFMNAVDYDFVRTMGLRIVQGRDFDRNIPGDAQRAVIINQAFADAYGWDNPLEAVIPGPFDEHEIIGVVRDFNFESLHTQIQPAILVLNPRLAFSGAADFDYSGSIAAKISARIKTRDLSETLAALRKAFIDVAPELPFSYSFVDDAIARQYVQEQRLSDIVGLGTLLAIFTAGLGIFGLAAISVARRTKEIGLRKALGAGIPSVVRLFLGEFAGLIAVAFVLAIPFAYFGMQRWLSAFAYQAGVGLIPFLAAGLGALAIMTLAVGSQSVRAALANPVDSLRDE